MVTEEYTKRLVQQEDEILTEIWDALWEQDSIRSIDMDSLSVYVKDRVVYLTGHLGKEYNRQLIECITQSVTGVVAVHNDLIMDRDLVIRVVQALARDEYTRSFVFPVNAFHGWIHIGGEVPTLELQHQTEKTAAEVSDVRGVVTLPKITGESPDKPRRAIQPQPGAVVYGQDGEIGIVSQVVIQPDNRLVTNVVVRVQKLRDGNLVAREHIVPIENIAQVKKGGVFLSRDGLSFNDYPFYNQSKYILPPPAWKPPYPYHTEEVLWLFQENIEGKSRHEYQSVIFPWIELDEDPDWVMAQAW
jgi:osmotically-inducible protein OsmY